MQIATQTYLATLDSNKSDKGVSMRELRSLDRDGDGRLSMSETGHRIDTRDLAALNAKMEAYSRVSGMFAFIDQDFAVFSRSELNKELFPGGVSGISEHDVRQGGVGDCYFMAAMAGLAKQRPQAIVDMISDNGNGTYTVKLPGASRAVTVDKPTDEELLLYAHGGENGSTWAAVLEKAYAKYTNSNRWFSKSNDRDAIDSGGMLSSGIYPMTGHGTNTDTLALTFKSTTRSRLQAALRDKKVVTASVNSLWGSKKEGRNNLPVQHVYTILSYDRASDTLRVRNPWGSGSDATNLKHDDGNNDGVFTMTMDEFYEYFSFIGYEEGN